MTSMQERAGSDRRVVDHRDGLSRNGTEIVLAWDPMSLLTQIHAESTPIARRANGRACRWSTITRLPDRRREHHQPGA